MPGRQLQDLGSRGFGVALASHVEHRYAVFNARGFLRGLQRNEIARALAVRHDAANGERAIQQRDVVADLQVLLLRDDVVGQHFVGILKRASGTIQEAATQGVKPFVVDAIDHDQILRLGQNHRRRNFIHAGQRPDLIAQALGHHGARKRDENGSVGRLHHDVRADAFHAFAPLGNHAGRKAHDHQHQNHLNGDRQHAERATQRTRGDVAPKHFHQRKRWVEV